MFFVPLFQSSTTSMLCSVLLLHWASEWSTQMPFHGMALLVHLQERPLAFLTLMISIGSFDDLEYFLSLHAQIITQANHPTAPSIISA
jgi:hypothetical protein